MQYSPKLKKAMEEIKAVMKKYDIGGIAVIHTPGFGEYIMNISPSYSAARIERENLIIRAKKEHYGSAALRDQFVTDTSNMLKMLSERTGIIAMNLMGASDQLDKQVDAEHTDGGHSSTDAQNN